MRKIATSLLIILLLSSCSSASESEEQTIVQTSDLFPGEYWVNEDDYYDGNVIIDTTKMIMILTSIKCIYIP